MILETFLLTKTVNTRESFTDISSNSITISKNVLYFIIALAFLYSLGAARLSWTYNRYLGNSVIISLIMSILAFLFSSFYYPMYALFLNPLGSVKKNILSSVNNAMKNLNKHL